MVSHRSRVSCSSTPARPGEISGPRFRGPGVEPASVPGAELAAGQDLKPTFLWVPSQKGLLAEEPQRQR